MKPVIIAIVGASGSGKTYMAEVLASELNIPTIVSYTTRPKRKEETEGKEHHFLPMGYKKPFRKDILAYTVFGGHEYFALHSQVPTEGVCSYVVDERGLEELTRNYSDRYTVVAVLVKCSPETLLKRGIDPGRVRRDKDRHFIDESFFDAIINNDGTPEEFIKEIFTQINPI